MKRKLTASFKTWIHEGLLFPPGHGYTDDQDSDTDNNDCGRDRDYDVQVNPLWQTREPGKLSLCRVGTTAEWRSQGA